MRWISLLISMILLSGCDRNWYVGEWTVSDVQFPGISALSLEEAREWLGSEARYSDTLFSFRGESCSDPQFQSETQTESEFMINYRAPFSQLGIGTETVEFLQVTCDSLSTFPGSTFIKAHDNTGYVPWDGVFFRLDKNTGAE